MNIIQGLDKVIQLNKERHQALKTVMSTKTKKVGLYLLEISEDEKIQTYGKVQRFYDSKIKSIYDGMNQELEKTGQEKLINPFERG